MKKLKEQFELARVMLAELSCEPCRFSILEKRVLVKAGTYATVTICFIFFVIQGSSLKLLVRIGRHTIFLLRAGCCWRLCLE